MRWSTVILGLLACRMASPPPVDTDPPRSAADRSREAAEDIAISVSAWRRAPDDARFGSVGHAVERGAAVPDPSIELDLALADAQANVLLDPTRAIPRFERHLNHLDAPMRDAWFDALLRASEFDRLEAEHRARLGAALDLDDPVIHVIADRSRIDPDVRWRTAADAVTAVKLVRALEVEVRVASDAVIPGVPVMLETLGYLDDGPWDVVAMPMPVDRWLGGVAIGMSSPEDLRRPGVEVALGEPVSAALAVRWRRDLQLGVWLAGDRVTATTDPGRLAIWIAAADRLARGNLAREEGLKAIIREEYGAAFLGGPSSNRPERRRRSRAGGRRHGPSAGAGRPRGRGHGTWRGSWKGRLNQDERGQRSEDGRPFPH